MNLDLTQIILGIITAALTIYEIKTEIKKNKKDADAKHEQQAEASNDVKARLARMESRQEQMERKVDKMDAALDANNLQTARIDLRQALQHSPDNIPAVLELARVYFLNYHGNADLGRKFLAWFKKHKVQEWANAHDEDVANLIEAASHAV